METIKTFAKDEQLNTFAHELLANGFQLIVLIPDADKQPANYFWFSKDDKIGSVNKGYFGEYTFSTVHRPCRECGTGYRAEIVDGEEQGSTQWAELTIKNALQALAFAPSWAYSTDCKAIVKYKSAQDFVESHNKQWAPIGHVYQLIEPITAN